MKSMYRANQEKKKERENPSVLVVYTKNQLFYLRHVNIEHFLQ